MSILQDIYGGGYAPSESLEKLPKNLSDKWWGFFEEVEKSMGLEFIDRHWDDLMTAELYRDYANFREGFCLGVALMMELR